MRVAAGWRVRNASDLSLQTLHFGHESRGQFSNSGAFEATSLMHSDRANPQELAPVLISSESQSAHGQPSATIKRQGPLSGPLAFVSDLASASAAWPGP
ncbi:MAG: hypothetical protein EBU15_12335 [Betaproteobacteria bacterium]|nr:hypothetical protein [Betaproteobacteria bacterium]